MRALLAALLVSCAPIEPEPPMLLPEQALSAWAGPTGECEAELDRIEVIYVRTAQQIAEACRGLDPSIAWNGCYWGLTDDPSVPPRIWYRTTEALPHELAHWLLDCSGEANRLGLAEGLGHGHPLFIETVYMLMEEQDAKRTDG